MLMGIFGIDKRCLSLAPQSVPVLEILRWMKVGSPDTNIYQIQIRSMLFLQTKIIMENTGKRTNQSKTATTLSCSWELTVQIPFEATESSGHVLDMILLLKWFSKSSTKQLLWECTYYSGWDQAGMLTCMWELLSEERGDSQCFPWAQVMWNWRQGSLEFCPIPCPLNLLQTYSSKELLEPKQPGRKRRAGSCSFSQVYDLKTNKCFLQNKSSTAVYFQNS